MFEWGARTLLFTRSTIYGIKNTGVYNTVEHAAAILEKTINQASLCLNLYSVKNRCVNV